MASRSCKEGRVIEVWKLAKVVMIEKKATDRKKQKLPANKLNKQHHQDNRDNSSKNGKILN